MNVEEIRKNWINTTEKDMDASIRMWDSVADHYKERSRVNWESNDFLKELNSTVELTDDMDILDIGCGAGLYTIALAEKVNKAVGFDISPKMIEIAKEKAKDKAKEAMEATESTGATESTKSTESTGATESTEATGSTKSTGSTESNRLTESTEAPTINTEFILGDWNKFDIKKENFEKKFDLVFAHMSPGINSAENFEKMIACSKKHCFLVKSGRRKDLIMDQIVKLAGIDNYTEKSDDNIVFAFQMLWKLGYCPRITYRQEEWEIEKTLDEANIWYVNRVKVFKKITIKDEMKIKEYLKDFAVDGKIREKTSTTIVTIYWEM